MVQNIVYLLGLILILGFLITAYFFNKKLSEISKNKTEEALLEWLKTMQVSLDSTRKTLDEAMSKSSNNMVKTLQENSKQLNERLDKAAAVIRDVGKEVGQMSEIGRNMQELQDFLKSPKLRGNIGEQVLKDLITQMFPKNSFHLQYGFKSGERVDAAIKTSAGILPIDSKFPMENFQKMTKAKDKETHDSFQKDFIRDVKKHIEVVSKKYILPEEGTMDFALMYVPSESVYYELANLPEIIDFARKQRIYIVSPSTLYVHLQAILLSFEGKRLESSSKEMFAMLRSIQIDYDKVSENLSVLGKHINNASSQFSNVTSSVSRLGQKIDKTQSIGEDTKRELSEGK
jgi:DNA recombination protein RmuC